MSNSVDLGPGLDALGAHALVPAELQEDLRLSLGRTREHALYAGQGCESLLDRACDQALDFLGRGSLVRNLHEDAGELDVGKFLQRQQA